MRRIPFRGMRKKSVERLIVISNMNHHDFVIMHCDYTSLMERGEIRLEEILRTTPVSSGAGTADGLNATSKLKDRLQSQYEAAYPGLAEIISHVIDQEEANARDLSPLFPHLVLPALVQIHMGEVKLQLPWRQPAFRPASCRFIESSQAPCSDNFCEELSSILS
jgi:hypothetical protein